MFAPPPAIDAEIFTCLPDAFDRRSERSGWLETQARGARHASFLEGPSFDRAGNLYCVDIAHGRIFRIAPDGTWALVADYDGEPNGLKIHADGRILVADHAHGILQLDPQSGAVTPLVDRPLLERFKGVNDLFITGNGAIYFTDQGQTGLQDPTGRVYRHDPDGRLERLLDGIPSPNGIVTNLGETAVYVAVTRDNAVWRLPLLTDGRTSKVGKFIQMTGGVGPDGMALDEAGNLAVAHAGLGSVWLFNPIGEPILRVRAPEGLMTTNVAYGGEDGRTLYITVSDADMIVTARMPVPGRPMHSHR